MNSQCECSRQMDEHLSAIGSHGRVRFIFRACLSHFSCLVLEGRARICDFSNARDLQWFSSLWDWTLRAKISTTLGFFLLRMRTKECRFSNGSLHACRSQQWQNEVVLSQELASRMAMMVGRPWWWRICTTVTSGVGCQDTSAGGIARVRMVCPLARKGVKMVIGHCCYPFQPPRVLGFLAGREPKLSSQLIKVERGIFWVRTDNFTASAISSTERFLLVRGNIFPNLCTGTSGSLFMFLKSDKESMNFWGLD